MQKIISFFSILLILISCSKKSPEIADPTSAPKVSQVPAQFTQKVVIEQFTESSAGQCPKANLILDSLIHYNPGKVFGVSIHVDDPLAVPSLVQSFSGRNYYDSVFNPLAIYPSGMVNRRLISPSDLSSDLWAVNTLSTLGEIPSCGVAIEADDFSGNNLTVIAHIGFSEQMFGQYRVHAYIVENQFQSNDSIYDQLNDFSASGSTPDTSLSLYNLNPTIHKYIHKYVLRKIIASDVTGIIIPEALMTKGNQYVLNYNVDLTGINSDNSSILIFVDKYALSPAGHRIINAQLVPIGQDKDWN